MFKLHEKLVQSTTPLGQFKLSLVLLHNDANYPWVVLVPKRTNIREIHHLSEVDQIQLIRESSHLSEVMSDIFAPETMNIAALGNLVPQLHIHHVARFESDACWPKAVWGTTEFVPYAASEQAARSTRLIDSLVGEGFEAFDVNHVDTPDPESSAGFTP
mgnify:CR=1 FL=1